MEYDLIIKNGYIVDGTGNPWFRADIGINDGKVVKIGNVDSASGYKKIEVKDLVVSPGFIDIHTHSDFSLIVDPRAESKIRQGVTTEVIGNCGFSAAPMRELHRKLLEQYLDPIRFKVELTWSNMGEYLSQLEKQGIAPNVASLVGHGTVRIAVMGFDNRSATDEELEDMKALVAQSMEDGSFGMSTGLAYPPACYSDTRELFELSKVVTKYGGIYVSHIRNEADTLIESVKEEIDIGKESIIPIEISHLKAAGKANWGKIKKILKIMYETRESGIDITCDQYPYSASCTFLNAIIPTWAHEGGIEKLIARLKDPKVLRRLVTEIEEGIPGWENPVKGSGWDKIMIVSIASEKNRVLEGKTIAEIAELRGEDPFDVAFDLLIEENGDVMMVEFAMCEEDVQMVMKAPFIMVGSDGSAVTPRGILGKGKQHPRSYGTFPRILGKYVREDKILTLQEAIRKMTSLPAQRLGLRDRGLIREGMWADITIFNPREIIDKATYTDPHQFPKGIEYVIINGTLTLEKGNYSGILSGKVLKH